MRTVWHSLVEQVPLRYAFSGINFSRVLVTVGRARTFLFNSFLGLMKFFPSIIDDIHHFHSVATRSVEVRSHSDVLKWLQGDMQRYLPHDIMIAAWGDFSSGNIQNDIISALPGVRSHNANPVTLNPFLMNLCARWRAAGRSPFSVLTGSAGFALQSTGAHCALDDALQTMRAAMVHGICDERGSHDCMYVTFTRKDEFSQQQLSALGILMPYIDTALRQVEHLPQQAHVQIDTSNPVDSRLSSSHDLSLREMEILQWVSIGKTNPEIGSILEISEFTVKNHMQRVFKKLDVSNRAQAVGKLNALISNG